MARRTLVALLTLVLTAAPAHAQTGQVLLDMTIQTLPGIPSGHCLYIEAGRFLVDARLTGDTQQPVRFSLGPAANVPASLDLRITTPSPTNAIAPVEAGIYCYMLTSDALVPENENVSDSETQRAQLVAVRLIWLPPS